MPDFIKLPSERVEQLRILSKNRDTPIADLIGEFIHDQIGKGHLTPDIPFVEVRRSGDVVEVDFGGFTRVMGLDLARAFATALHWFATPKASPLSEAAKLVSGADLVGISRRGTAVKVAGEAGGERTFAPSVARDLAGLIKDAAA